MYTKVSSMNRKKRSTASNTPSRAKRTRKRKQNDSDNNNEEGMNTPTNTKKNRKQRTSSSRRGRMGLGVGPPCVICNHFQAKKECTMNKCRRCCGKNGTKRCEYHHSQYEEEKQIIELANSNRNNILKHGDSCNNNTDLESDIFQPISSDMYHEKSFKNIGDTACIFNINTMFINEKNDWLENQERKYLRNLKFKK
jgi:hypothetical protein